MRGYSCSEIGMLVGAAIGGILSEILFFISNNVLSFGITVATIAAGVVMGKRLDSLKSGPYSFRNKGKGLTKENEFL